MRQSVRNYIAGCSWNQQQGRLETANGDPVFGWLNQTGTPTQQATVQWEAGTSSDLGNAVAAAVPEETWAIIKNGSFDEETGLVTYKNESYRFRFEIVQGTATMEPHA